MPWWKSHWVVLLLVWIGLMIFYTLGTTMGWWPKYP